LDILSGKNRRTPSTIYLWICRSGYSITRQRILKSEIYGCITYGDSARKNGGTRGEERYIVKRIVRDSHKVKMVVCLALYLVIKDKS
jgi:hypothetical protein